MALDEDLGMVMIELKNYHGSKIPREIDKLLEQKFKDTGQLIRVVNKYLERQIFYRLIFKRMGWRKLCPEEWTFWSAAYQCLQDERVVKLVDIQR